MHFELRYAFRNLLSRRGGLARLTTFAALAGIAFGVASLIIVQAMYRGFRTGIESGLLAQTAHVTVTPIKSDVILAAIVVERLQSVPNVRRVEQAIFQSSVITSEGQSAYGLLKVGFDKSPQGKRPGVWLGKVLAERIGAKKSGAVTLITPGPDGDAAVFDSKVAGVFETGIYEYDSNLVKIDSEEFSKHHSSVDGYPISFLIELDKPFEVEKAAQDLSKAAGPGYAVSDWRTSNKPLFTALSLERKIAAAVFLLMIGIASLGVMATLVLLVGERRVDLAVLKTCGARSRSLAIIFLTEGAAISGIGIIVGIAMGLFLIAAFNYMDIIRLPGEVYSISKLTLIHDEYTTLMIAGGTFLLMIPSILIPVIAASRISPGEILRKV